MQIAQVEALRALLAPTGWLDRTRHFAGELRRHARTPQGLLIVGTPADEPWHMTAHLADESQLAGLPGLMPTLVRWAPPPGAPPHLSVGMERLERAGRTETLLVVSPDVAPERLLDRVADAKKAGAAIFALDQGDPELAGLVHESLAITPEQAPISFDAAQHLVSFTVADLSLRTSPDELADLAASQLAGSATAPPGLRGRLNRLLTTISGPQAQ